MTDHQDRPWYETSEFDGPARFSDRVLRQAGWTARIPPNVVTLIGGLLVVPMYVTFTRGLIVWGAILFTISAITDWLDGALARYQQRLHDAGRLDLQTHRRPSLRLGPTEFGKLLDPFVDKVRYFAALWPLGWHVLPHALIWAALTIALALTFGRMFVELRWGLKPGANGWGKFKALNEILSVALLVFLTSGAPLALATTIAFSAATLLGGVSFFTQTRSVMRLRRAQRAAGLPVATARISRP